MATRTSRKRAGVSLRKTPGRSGIRTGSLRSASLRRSSRGVSPVKTSSARIYKTKPAFSNSDNYMLRDLFVDELKKVYWSEKALSRAMSKMVSRCHSEELSAALMRHQRQTEGHSEKLQRVFSEMGLRPLSSKSDSMDALINEAEKVVSRIKESSVRDAAIILASQRIEHHEIASYGTLCVFANMLNEGTVASILKEIIAEEKRTDEILSGIAEGTINVEALIEREWEE